MEKLTRARIKTTNSDGSVSYSDPVPFGTSSEEVVLSDGRTLEEFLGQIRAYSTKNLAQMLEALDVRISKLENGGN